eukprot:4242812-Prymnesium_polylepis.1
MPRFVGPKPLSENVCTRDGLCLSRLQLSEIRDHAWKSFRGPGPAAAAAPASSAHELSCATPQGFDGPKQNERDCALSVDERNGDTEAEDEFSRRVARARGNA